MNEWDDRYDAMTEPMRYGSVATYAIAADWMRTCATVEDWGCGGAALAGYLLLGNPDTTYRGIDGSSTPFADVHADLATYVPDVLPEGIVLRHVLEHSYNWQTILNNALGSFAKRLCIVLFTPWVFHTHVLHTEPAYADVPVIAFAEDDILDPIHETGLRWWSDVYRLDGAHFGTETVIRIERS